MTKPHSLEVKPISVAFLRGVLIQLLSGFKSSLLGKEGYGSVTDIRILRAEIRRNLIYNLRRARAMAELEAIHDQLAGGTKLGGKPRRAAGAAERARINVQRRIADAIKRIGEHAPEVGRHLECAIRTGAYCSYDPRRR